MYELRLRRLVFVFVALLTLIAVRAFALQIGDAGGHVENFQKRRLRTFPILPRRGEILYADGSRMAWNVPGFALEIAFGELDDRVLPDSARLAASFGDRAELDRAEEAARLARCSTDRERRVVERQIAEARVARDVRRTGLVAQTDALVAEMTKKRPRCIWECSRCGRRVKYEDAPDKPCRDCQAENSFTVLPPLDLHYLASVLETDVTTVEAALVQALARRSATPTYRLHAFLLRIPPDAARTIASFPRRFPGFEVHAKRARDVDDAARTIAGTTRLPTSDDLRLLCDESRTDRGLHRYSATEVYQSLVGATFLERRWDEELRGVPGSGLRARADGGRIVEGFELEQPVRDGVTLQSSVRPGLQRLAMEIAAGAPEDGHGAAVVLDARTGAVLAIASTQNDGYDHARSHVVPGSVFKLVTAYAFLASGGSPSETTYCTERGRTPRGRRTKCTHAHGEVALREAFEVSCNHYFATMAERLGVEAMADACRVLGMERNHDIGIETWEDVASGRSTVGVAGLAYCGPDQPKGPRGWEAVDMYLIGIGQGKASCSPLQVAVAYARVASGGHMIRPWIVDRVRDAAGPTQLHAGLAAAAPILRESARLVITSGTGAGVEELNTPPVAASGKSGTAEVDRTVTLADGTRVKQRRNNTWFVGYAPYDDPRYVAVVVWERMPHGKYGADVVGGFVGHLLREALEGDDGGRPAPGAAGARDDD